MDKATAKNFVALFGEWNTTNLGDQAIGIHATQYYLKAGLGVKLFAMGSLVYLGKVTDCSQVDIFFEQLYTKARLNQNEKSISINRRKVRLSSLARKVLFVEQSLRYARNQNRWELLKKDLCDCCLIAVGGGDLLNKENRPFLTPLHFITTFSNSTKVPLICLGCSSSDSPSGLHKRILREFLRCATIISTRDYTTKRVLENLSGREISLFGDFALQLNSTQRKKPSDLVTLAINVMRVPNKFEGTYERILTTLVQSLSGDKKLRLVLFTTGNMEDWKFAQAYEQKVSHPIVVIHPTSLCELKEFYNSVDLVIATRLHAAILAIDQEVPAIAISVSPKIRNFYEAIGLSEFCFDLSDEPNDIIALVKNRHYRQVLEKFCNEDFFEERSRILNSIVALVHHNNSNFNKEGGNKKKILEE